MAHGDRALRLWAFDSIDFGPGLPQAPAQDIHVTQNCFSNAVLADGSEGLCVCVGGGGDEEEREEEEEAEERTGREGPGPQDIFQGHFAVTSNLLLPRNSSSVHCLPRVP